MQKAISRKNILEAAPVFLQQTIGRLLEPVPMPWLLGKEFRQCRRHVGVAQCWGAEETRRYQLERLQKILTLACERTTFYRKIFALAGFNPQEFRCLDQILDLPAINRAVVTDNLADMCTKCVSSTDVDEVFTGGTDGFPLRFYANASRSAAEYAHLTSSWGRTGYKLGMPMVVLRSRIIRADRGGFYHEYDPLLKHHHYSSFHMSDENMGRYVEHMGTIGACFLHVYPSTVAALARFLRRTGMRPPGNIQGIIAESEIVYPEQREMVEETFGCRLFSCYGQSEKVVLAAGCEHSDDYHVWPTYGYFELLDKNGQPVTTPGQRGEIVGTGFINTVMPFIRYRTGDWATYVGDRCEACGREHTIIRDIRGHRTQEMLIAADGSEIPWTALNMHDDTFSRVRQFQFRQETAGRAILRVVPSEGYDENDDRRIQQNLGRKFDGQLTFSIEQVDAIPLSARGKAIYVDQRIGSPVGKDA